MTEKLVVKCKYNIAVKISVAKLLMMSMVTVLDRCVDSSLDTAS